MENKRNNRLYQGCVFFALMLLTFIYVMHSPLNPWTNGESSADSSVFKYMAYAISRGYMPYKDSFDHKGPVIYIINYIAQLLSYYRGTWILEYVNMLIYIVFMYKIARLFCSRPISILMVILCNAQLFNYFEGGNFTEEYALPCIAISLYIFIDYFINNQISKWRLILCGATFGIVFLLRANMISVWIVFCIAVLISHLMTQKKIPWNFLLYFCIGWLSVTVPFMIWLIQGGAFQDFIQDYIVFNMKYSAVSDDENALWYNRVDAFLFFCRFQMIVVGAVLSIYFIKLKENMVFHVAYLVYIILTLYTVAMSGRIYGHYGMILFPLTIYPISRVYLLWNDYSKKGLVILFILMLVLINYDSLEWNLRKIANIWNDTHEIVDITEGQKEILWIIDQNTSWDERILVLGNHDFYYVQSQRLAASRYSYQLPIVNVDSDIRENFIHELVMNQPKIIVVQKDYAEDVESLFVTIDNYELLYVTDENEEVYRLK